MNIDITYKGSEHRRMIQVADQIALRVKRLGYQEFGTELGQTFLKEGEEDIYIRYHRLPKAQGEKPVMPAPRVGTKPTDYKACRLWHARTGSFGAYIEAMCKRAFEAQIPIDALYEKAEGGWVFVRDLPEVSWFRHELKAENISFE